MKNNRNIYESGDRMQNLRVQEQKRSDRNYAQFFNDVNTNMVMELPGKNLELNKTEWADEDLPLEYNGDLNKTQLFQLEKDRLEGSNNSNFGISLSGEPIKEDTFNFSRDDCGHYRRDYFYDTSLNVNLKNEEDSSESIKLNTFLLNKIFY